MMKIDNVKSVSVGGEITEADILNMSERLTKLRISIKIKEEENKKLLSDIATLISSIDDETMSVLTEICPEAEVLTSITIDDIMKDVDGASEKIHSILTKLYTFLEKQLEYFEGLI